MNIDPSAVRKCLKAFDFTTLFREHLGWGVHEAHLEIPVKGDRFKLNAVAEKRGFVAYLCEGIPTRAVRMKIDRVVTKSSREHFIIYCDESRGTQVWQWVRREAGKPLASRDHRIDVGGTCDPLIQRLEKVAIAIDEEDSLTVVDVAGRTRAAFDVEKVTKKFYDRFRTEHKAFHKLIDGIDLDSDREWYASLMLNRLMFVYFIQKKGFLDSDTEYLRNRLRRVQEIRGQDHFQSFYRFFLLRMFHDGLGKSPAERRLNRDLEKLLGKVPYLNGGFFELHPLEERHSEIDIPDDAFVRLFDFFDEFAWHLDERPLKDGNEINPDVVGYIFEKYINQKQMGAYYTKEDITEYICKNTIIPFLFDAAQKKCPIAFRPESFLWQLLRDDPDRYIYPPLRHGVIDPQGGIIPLPKPVEAGIKHVSKRDEWNHAAPDSYALPTETWREYVARRQRCLELREKLGRGDVDNINELITLNLDIWQFARDAIINSEGPELLRAFWHAIAGRIPEKSNERFEPGITVLDPTCGSGAFLFAALRILETLYSDCLQAMAGFLDEPEAPPPEDVNLRALIARGENDRCEFKSSMRHCIKTEEASMPEDKRKEVLKAKDKERNHDVLKSVAAMLNSNGGDVIVGVRDDGSPYGLEHDYQYFSKEVDRNPDGYELWLRQHFVNHFGVLNSKNIRVNFVMLDGKLVMWLQVAPGQQASYVLSDSKHKILYIRNGNETRALDTDEAVAYHASRFTPEAIQGLPTRLAISKARPAKKRRCDDFREILDQIRQHPSERYFILKSIIIGNLFGVDIMEEAVEICKLRLFLRLVAEVERVEQIEPLPDIDFNIRVGNTLVGYTHSDEIRQARSSIKAGDSRQRLLLDDNDDAEIRRIEEDALAVYKCFEQFRLQQTIRGGKITSKEKIELRRRLASLDDELNRYLIGEYAVKTKSRSDSEFAGWKRSHKPFHWFVEFNGIMSNGGFDVVIGNPPYVATSKVSYLTSAARSVNLPDLYAHVVFRSVRVASASGRFGMIVPLSVTFSEDFEQLRLYLSSIGNAWFCSFDNIPAALFAGVSQRCTIWLGNRCKPKVFTSQLYRWRSSTRGKLIPSVMYTKLAGECESVGKGVPRVASVCLANWIEAFQSARDTRRAILSDKKTAAALLRFSPSARNFVSAFIEPPPCLDDSSLKQVDSSDYGSLNIKINEYVSAAMIAVVGECFFHHWLTWGDGFHVTNGNVASFMRWLEVIPERHFLILQRIGDCLWARRNEALVFKRNAGKYVGNYNYRGHAWLTRRADLVLMAALGFRREIMQETFDYVQRVLAINEFAGEKAIPAAVKAKYRPLAFDVVKEGGALDEADSVISSHFRLSRSELKYLLSGDTVFGSTEKFK
jgi:hypothetical protein